MRPFSKVFLLILFTCFSLPKANAVDDIQNRIYGGVCLRKYVGFYWMNGISGEYWKSQFLGNRIGFGLNYTTSSLGSAAGTYALPVHAFEASVISCFRRNKPFQLTTRLNMGYAYVDYGSDIYDGLPNSDLLLSLEPGISYDFRFPLRIYAGLGYQFMTGDGITGLGVIFPVYVQTVISYRLSY